MALLAWVGPSSVQCIFSAMGQGVLPFCYLDSRLSPVPDFGVPPPPPLLYFCLFAIFSSSFILSFSVITSATMAKCFASLLDDEPQTWLLIWDRSVYLSNVNFRSLPTVSEGVGISPYCGPLDCVPCTQRSTRPCRVRRRARVC